MKTDRKGRIVLQKGDYRTGNFIFHEEGQYIKVMATSGIVSWRVASDSAIGQMILIALKDKLDGWLKTYAAMNFSQLMVVPDQSFFENHAALVNEQATKHPEFYGKQASVSEAEDAEILQEERELHETVEKVAE